MLADRPPDDKPLRSKLTIYSNASKQSTTQRQSPLTANDLTDAEQRLWARLRRKQILGVQFYRQKPIGNYIADFYAPAAQLVVEVDGSQHFESLQAETRQAPNCVLESAGLTSAALYRPTSFARVGFCNGGDFSDRSAKKSPLIPLCKKGEFLACSP